ncbi:hypothetical protein IFM89_004029 [Coptis chinensis]|uniref:Glucan endo-1,3-beta-D-glucosidase n=1 Tax=Coptis chinensis TaxID=261450 RepID=A0A835GVI1_9MAGN|nr:hypothetical protein IFM89_004029 [Coptis chinensis]
MYMGPVLLQQFVAFSSDKGAFVGVNIGTDVTNLPSPVEVVAVLKANQISHVRLFDADRGMLNALANTSIEVMVGVTNEEVLGIGQSPSKAAAWVTKNVAAYVPQTNITAIAVGSEVLTTIPNAAPVLVPAMNYIHRALVASNLNFQWNEEDATVLVPGDVISIKLGDIVPADARLLEGDPLKIDQSSLTGESLPVTKGPGDGVYSGSTLGWSSNSYFVPSRNQLEEAMIWASVHRV